MKKHFQSLFISVTVIAAISLFLYFQTNNKTRSADFYQMGCTLLDYSDFSMVKKFPGDNCLFLPDGKMIQFQFGSLEYLDQKLTPVWKQSLESHHPPLLYSDNKTIYFLSNHYENFKGIKTRFDQILSLDIQSGKVLKSWNSAGMTEEFEKAADWNDPYLKEKQLAIWGNNFSDVKYEFLHFNSIYEIPENSNSSKFDYLKKGNLIVSAGISLILFFDRELNLLKINQVSDFQGIQFHDAQITKEGNILLYRNYQDIAPEQSSIQIFEPKNMDLEFEYPEDPVVSKFYSHCCGGVQIQENGHFLFNDLTEGGRFQEIDSKGVVYRTFISREIDPKTKNPYDFFNVKKVNLKEYFKNVY